MAISPKPMGLSVKALVHNGADEVLLLRRSRSSEVGPNDWDLPGGKFDRSESFEAALVREVYEETGLTITLDRVAGTVEFELPDVRVVCLIMKGRVASGKVRLSSEHEDYAWVSRRQLSTFRIWEPLQSFFRDHLAKAIS